MVIVFELGFGIFKEVFEVSIFFVGELVFDGFLWLIVVSFYVGFVF